MVSILIIVLVGAGLVFLLSSPPPVQQAMSSKKVQYKEIVAPAGFINTNGEEIKIGDYVGKKIIVLDVMTYSCINCQRSFPYVTNWYEKYKDKGLIVIGIHTPEFAFEKDKKNVEKAMKEFGINFPVVLDNEYGTWNAYGNRYWPRKYLIDINGNIVYDHIGEGAYEEIEMKIRELLQERTKLLGEKTKSETEDALVSSKIPEQQIESGSPETYFGFLRNEYLGNGIKGRSGLQTFTVPDVKNLNTLYLGGTWDIKAEHAESVKESRVIYLYNAKKVYIVASGTEPVNIEVWQDGALVETKAGEDVRKGIVTIQESKLYKLINNASPGEHTLELRIPGSGVMLFAFTFG